MSANPSTPSGYYTTTNESAGSFGYHAMLNESATLNAYTFLPMENLSTEAIEDLVQYSEYGTSFRVVLSLVLLMEDLGGLICNILVLIMFHLHHKTTPSTSMSGNITAGQLSCCALHVLANVV